MPYANLLVHVQDDDGSDARIRLATSLATRFGAALTGMAAAKVDAIVSVPQEAGQSHSGRGLAGSGIEFVESELRSAQTRFRNIVTAAGIEGAWQSRLDDPAQAVCSQAMTADLIVAGRRIEGKHLSAHSALDPADVIMRSGRPVLVVPPGIEAVSAERVIVAWKNSREAKRAIIDALPFLQAASQVHVVEFARRQDVAAARKQAHAVAEYLHTHGVAATGHAAPFRRGTTAEQLIDFATQNNADLVVAGGYGRIWLYEWTFGGVTQILLQRSPLCCLMSH